MKCIVREGFVAHVKDEDGTTHSYAGGKTVDLTDAQYADHAHQVEVVVKKKDSSPPVPLPSWDVDPEGKGAAK
jgi:hypothetical protein